MLHMFCMRRFFVLKYCFETIRQMISIHRGIIAFIAWPVYAPNFHYRDFAHFGSPNFDMPLPEFYTILTLLAVILIISAVLILSPSFGGLEVALGVPAGVHLKFDTIGI